MRSPDWCSMARALTGLAVRDESLKAFAGALEKFKAEPDATDALLGFLAFAHDHLVTSIKGGELLDFATGTIFDSCELLEKFCAGLDGLVLAVANAKVLDGGLRNLAEQLLIPDARTLPPTALLRMLARYLPSPPPERKALDA